MIHATTKKIAAKNNIVMCEWDDIYTDADECFINAVDFIPANDENAEIALAVYVKNDDGSYTFHECHHPSIREELPAAIFDEKHLREVIKFLGTL